MPSRLDDKEKIPFNVYTAIDILDKECVRLKQGDFEVSTTYNKDPVLLQNVGISSEPRCFMLLISMVRVLVCVVISP